jgi:hypothetical protein
MSYNYTNIEGLFKFEGYEQSVNGEIVLVGTLLVSADDADMFKFPVKIFASHYATKDLLTQDNNIITVTGKLIPYQKSLAIYVSWYNAPKVEAPVVEEDKTEA